MFHFSEGRRTFAGAKYIATLNSVPHVPNPFVVVVGGGGDGSQWFALCEGYLHFTPVINVQYLPWLILWFVDNLWFGDLRAE